MFAGFRNQSSLLTMVKFSTQRETINLQLIQRRSQSPKYKFCKGKLTDCLLGIEMVQVSQNNDKRSIFAEYYLSETVLYLSDNMVPTPKHLYGGRELPLKNPNCGGFLKFIIPYCNNNVVVCNRAG